MFLLQVFFSPSHCKSESSEPQRLYIENLFCWGSKRNGCKLIGEEVFFYNQGAWGLNEFKNALTRTERVHSEDIFHALPDKFDWTGDCLRWRVRFPFNFQGKKTNFVNLSNLKVKQKATSHTLLSQSIFLEAKESCVMSVFKLWKLVCACYQPYFMRKHSNVCLLPMCQPPGLKFDFYFQDVEEESWL